MSIINKLIAWYQSKCNVCNSKLVDWRGVDTCVNETCKNYGLLNKEGEQK